jgi:hypothetical protein
MKTQIAMSSSEVMCFILRGVRYGLMRIVPNYSAFRKRNSPKRSQALRLFEIAGVLSPRDHIANFIVNANHSAMRAAVNFA